MLAPSSATLMPRANRTRKPSHVSRFTFHVSLLLALAPTPAFVQAAPTFAHSAFSSVWERTDAPVASGAVKRTWFWGPQPNSEGTYEDYKEGAGGKRIVQYFDKSRMEINDPEA